MTASLLLALLIFVLMMSIATIPFMMHATHSARDICVAVLAQVAVAAFLASMLDLITGHPAAASAAFGLFLALAGVAFAVWAWPRREKEEVR